MAKTRHHSDVSKSSLLPYFFEEKRVRFIQLEIYTKSPADGGKNQGSYQDIMLASLPRKNEIWLEICNVAKGPTWSRILSIDI